MEFLLDADVANIRGRRIDLTLRVDGMEVDYLADPASTIRQAMSNANVGVTENEYFTASLGGVALEVDESIEYNGVESGAKLRVQRPAVALCEELGLMSLEYSGFQGRYNDRYSYGEAPPLVHYTCENERDTVQRLIDARANLEGKDQDGSTALMWAAYAGNIGIGLDLLKARADPNAQEHTYGTTPLLNAAIANANEHDTTLTKAILEAKADIDTRNSTDNSTALFLACNGRREAQARFLLASGADANIKTVRGRTVLSLAQRKCSRQLVSLLQQHGAH